MIKNNIGKAYTTIIVDESTQGEFIENKILRIVSNNEPIKDGAPIIFTERKDGIKPEYDPRADRFEIAIEATDKIAKTYQAKRAEAIEKRGKAPLIQTTDPPPAA